MNEISDIITGLKQDIINLERNILDMRQVLLDFPDPQLKEEYKWNIELAQHIILQKKTELAGQYIMQIIFYIPDKIKEKLNKEKTNDDDSNI
jgi:hypothetical protein